MSYLNFSEPTRRRGPIIKAMSGTSRTSTPGYLYDTDRPCDGLAFVLRQNKYEVQCVNCTDSRQHESLEEFQ